MSKFRVNDPSELFELRERPKFVNNVFSGVIRQYVNIFCKNDFNVIEESLKNIYLALAINVDGYKELLEIWIDEKEGAKFCAQVLTEPNNRVGGGGGKMYSSSVLMC